MANRLTDTNKWHDSWFSSLKPLEKLLFNYLCDNCDIAGFIEIIKKNWASDIGCQMNQIEGALKELERGLIISNTNDCAYLRNFLKHQKNLPLNESNQCHKGILARFELYKSKFEINDINDFIQGAQKGLRRCYGIGNGIGNSNIYLKEKDINLNSTNTWKTHFETYQKELKKAYKDIVTPEYISERQKFHSGLDIINSLVKSCKDFWNTEAGWKNKKASRCKEIDWKATFNNALTLKMNQVWLPKDTLVKGENPPGFKYPSVNKPILRAERI